MLADEKIKNCRLKDLIPSPVTLCILGHFTLHYPSHFLESISLVVATMIVIAIYSRWVIAAADTYEDDKITVEP